MQIEFPAIMKMFLNYLVKMAKSEKEFSIPSKKSTQRAQILI